MVVNQQLQMVFLILWIMEALPPWQALTKSNADFSIGSELDSERLHTPRHMDLDKV
jgi:hypothetical protein